jgi:hypothetical protein
LERNRFGHVTFRNANPRAKMRRDGAAPDAISLVGAAGLGGVTARKRILSNRCERSAFLAHDRK